MSCQKYAPGHHTIDPCLQIEHYGGKLPTACPKCQHINQDILDCYAAPGVMGSQCGHYWEPEDIPQAVFDEAARLTTIQEEEE